MVVRGRRPVAFEAYAPFFMAQIPVQPDRACRVVTLEAIVYNHPQKATELIESDYLGEAGKIDGNNI